MTVLINVDKLAREVTIAEPKGRKLDLHKVQQKSGADPLARNARYNGADGPFSIPPRTTVVFVEN